PFFAARRLVVARWPRLAAAVFFRAPLEALLFVVRFTAGFAPRRLGASPASTAGVVATTGVGCSATCTVRCAVRLTTRNARPIGAGPIRFCDGPLVA